MKVIRWKKDKGQPNLDMIRGLVANEVGLSRPYTWSDAPGKFYPEHIHNEDELRWIVQGSLTVGVNGKEIKLKAGDRIELPAGTPHWAKVAEDAPIIYICATRSS
jgi:quercetin dioxygenase-like cupin family protein